MPLPNKPGLIYTGAASGKRIALLASSYNKARRGVGKAGGGGRGPDQRRRRLGSAFSSDRTVRRTQAASPEPRRRVPPPFSPQANPPQAGNYQSPAVTDGGVDSGHEVGKGLGAKAGEALGRFPEPIRLLAS